MDKVFISADELAELIRVNVREALSLHASNFSASSKPMSVEQAALYLNLPKATLYQLTSKREIPFRKLGRRLLFLESELQDYLQNSRKATRQEIEINVRPSKRSRS
jgi:excisionase family DNA binding protein